MEGIQLLEFPDLIKKNLKVKEIKSLIKEKEGIKEENLIFQLVPGYSQSFNDNEDVWEQYEIHFYDITNYQAYLERDIGKKRVYLDLNKKVEELKQDVFEQTKFNKDRIEFYLDNKILSNDRILKNENLFKKKLSIRISKKLNDFIYVKINSEIKKVQTDLYNTVLELLQQFQEEPIITESSLDIKYDAFYKNEQLNYSDFLIDLGINGDKNGDLIELKIRNKYPIFVLDLTRKKFTISVQKSDTVALVKLLFYYVSEIPPDQQRIVYAGKQLEDSKTLDEYGIGDHSTLHLVLRVRG